MNNPPPTVGRPTWLEIDPQGVVANYRLAKQRVGASVAVYPVVKADGYGLGALPLSQALVKAGAKGLCVGLVEEGAQLRQGGISVPLVLFAGLTPGVERLIIDLDLTPFLYDLQTAHSLSREAVACKRQVPCYVKVNTGMGRIGFPPEQLATLLPTLQALPGLQLLGIVSHLACSDEGEEGRVTSTQIRQFNQALTLLKGENSRKYHHSLANSGGTLYHPDSHFDWVRPGIMLYGASPAFPHRNDQEEGLVSVVRWLSRVIQIRSFPAGTPLGYGHTFTTQKKSLIAQIPVGYGDGYARRLGNLAHVLIAGREAPVVGRVCMDLISVDVTDIPTVEVGSLVTLLGEDGTKRITIEDMARWLETIPYEVICALGKRVPRYHSRS
ncbi:MAG: alanine racemase [Magnetococcales bacterium]|nr:alanine racemase [Magnetococcales bacterium]